jgi:hypothetical protein
LLKEHISYGPLVQKLLKKFNPNSGLVKRPKLPVKAFAHITGGGFVDNIPRVLPKSLDVVIKKGSWDMLPIFQIIAEKSGVPDEELYQVFNMGIGMVASSRRTKADARSCWFEIHPRAEAQGVAHRRSRQRQGRGAVPRRSPQRRFPDWVVAHKDWKLRSTDTNFLAAVKILYARLPNSFKANSGRTAARSSASRWTMNLAARRVICWRLKKIAD